MILFQNYFLAPALEAVGMPLLETEGIALGLLVLLYHFVLSVIHRFHGHATLLLPSHIPRPHGRTIGSRASGLSSLDEHKYWPNFTHRFQASTMMPSSLLFRALLALPDPPWVTISSQKLFVDKRILMFQGDCVTHFSDLSSKGISHRGQMNSCDIT